jgi:hypothetical protein
MGSFFSCFSSRPRQRGMSQQPTHGLSRNNAVRRGPQQRQARGPTAPRQHRQQPAPQSRPRYTLGANGRTGQPRPRLQVAIPQPQRASSRQRQRHRPGTIRVSKPLPRRPGEPVSPIDPDDPTVGSPDLVSPISPTFRESVGHRPNQPWTGGYGRPFNMPRQW